MKPTIGRIVHYWANQPAPDNSDALPEMAFICSINPDGRVNLSVLSHMAVSRSAFGVTFFNGKGDRPSSDFAEWPPKV